MMAPIWQAIIGAVVHKKICTNNDDVETETKIVTTYKVYVPGGAANIGFITAN